MLQHFRIVQRKKIFCCQKVSTCGVFSGPYFPVFGLKTEIYEINLPILSEYRKLWTRKNSVLGHFSRSGRSGKKTLSDIYKGTFFVKIVNGKKFLFHNVLNTLLLQAYNFTRKMIQYPTCPQKLFKTFEKLSQQYFRVTTSAIILIIKVVTLLLSFTFCSLCVREFTAQKRKFSVKGFFSQKKSSHLLKKSIVKKLHFLCSACDFENMGKKIWLEIRLNVFCRSPIMQKQFIVIIINEFFFRLSI